MAIYFKDLRIESFRGMKDLDILGLKDIKLFYIGRASVPSSMYSYFYGKTGGAG